MGQSQASGQSANSITLDAFDREVAGWFDNMDTVYPCRRETDLCDKHARQTNLYDGVYASCSHVKGPGKEYSRCVVHHALTPKLPPFGVGQTLLQYRLLYTPRVFGVCYECHSSGIHAWLFRVTGHTNQLLSDAEAILREIPFPEFVVSTVLGYIASAGVRQDCGDRECRGHRAPNESAWKLDVGLNVERLSQHPVKTREQCASIRLHRPPLAC